MLFDLDVNRKRGVFTKRALRIKRNFIADEFISDVGSGMCSVGSGTYKEFGLTVSLRGVEGDLKGAGRGDWESPPL